MIYDWDKQLILINKLTPNAHTARWVKRALTWRRLNRDSASGHAWVRADHVDILTNLNVRIRPNGPQPADNLGISTSKHAWIPFYAESFYET